MDNLPCDLDTGLSNPPVAHPEGNLCSSSYHAPSLLLIVCVVISRRCHGKTAAAQHSSAVTSIGNPELVTLQQCSYCCAPRPGARTCHTILKSSTSILHTSTEPLAVFKPKDNDHWKLDSAYRQVIVKSFTPLMLEAILLTELFGSV